MENVSSRSRVLVADDDPVTRHGLRSVLAATAGVELVADVARVDLAVQAATRLRPDLVVLSSRSDGAAALAAARRLDGVVPVLLIGAWADEHAAVVAVASGARGHLVHGRFSVAELTRAVQSCLAGEIHLSPALAGTAARWARQAALGSAADAAAGLTTREREIMDLVSQGLSNLQIAHRLYLAEKTVKNNLTRAFVKLHASNRAQAAAVYTGQAADRLDVVS